jgi:fructan beta-fructosidase
LVKLGAGYRLASMPVNELNKYNQKPLVYNYPNVSKGLSLGAASVAALPCRIDLDMSLETFAFTIFNENEEEVKVGYDKQTGNYFIDRTRAGKSYFHKEFAARHTSQRLTSSKKLRMTLIIDVASVELFADGGLTTMTSVFFPTISFNKLSFQSDVSPVSISYAALKPLE